MNSTISRFLTATFLLMMSLVAGAQITHKSFGGGTYDSIDLSNLATDIHIPLRTRAGVIPLTPQLTMQTSLDKNYQKPPHIMGHWPHLLFSDFAKAKGIIQLFACTNGKTGRALSNYYVQTDSDIHTLPLVNFNTCFQSSATYKTTDGSGFTVVFTRNDTTYDFTTAVYDKSGNLVTSSSLTDPNGNIVNKATITGGYSYNDATGTVLQEQSTMVADQFCNPSIQGVLCNSQLASKPTSFSYSDATNTTRSYSITYTTFHFATSFGCASGDADGSTIISLPTQISIPDGSAVSLSYEQTVGFGVGYTTGRIKTITYPQGGTVTFGYSGGDSTGYFCFDGTTAGMTRTTTDGTWSFTRNPTPDFGVNHSTTTIVDPRGNKMVLDFDQIGHIVQKKTYTGSTSLETTDVYCYNGNVTNCSTTYDIGYTITQLDVFHYVQAKPNPSQMETKFDSYGQVVETRLYDFGPTLVSIATTAYANGAQSCGPVNQYIHDKPCTVQTTDAVGNTMSKTTFTYDSHGNSLTKASLVSGTTYLTTQYTYDANGVPRTVTDPKGTATTYTNTMCHNQFPQSIIGGGQTNSFIWDCNGGVITSHTLPNGTSTVAYNDPLYRPSSSTDELGVQSTINYGLGSTYTKHSTIFNSGQSVATFLDFTDAYGRPAISQQQLGPSSTNYLTTSTVYDSAGRKSFVSKPCTTTLGSSCGTSHGHSFTYDGLDRVLTTNNTVQPSPGISTKQYLWNDVLTTKSPAPAGEAVKKVQVEYDGLGRVISECEISTLPGFASCGQHNSVNGFRTAYTYDAVGRVLSIIRGSQTRSFTYDRLGRLISETTPEAGTVQYFYDSAPATPGIACSLPTSKGDLVKTYDANGNTVCYEYDSLHRMTATKFPGGPGILPERHFVYDSAVVNGLAMQHAMGMLAEAYTGTAAAKIIDEGFSYDALGNMLDMYQSTPHSGGWYHSTVTYFANRVPQSLSTAFGTWNYTVDGAGRPFSVAKVSSNTIVSSVSRDSASKPLTVTYGNGDHDDFTYDPDLGVMASFGATVGNPASSLLAALAWNPIGTLKQLNISVDQFNPTNVQICNYKHDDVSRLASVDCGAKWQQNFSYDQYGNIVKTVPVGGAGINFQATYSLSTNRIVSLPGVTPTYDNNGNMLNDGTYSYSWDAMNKPATINGIILARDALGRVVEQQNGSTYTETQYTPLGRYGLMTGQSIKRVFVGIPGGGQMEYTPSYNLVHHPDNLGSSRLITRYGNRSLHYDGAFAPFGESYVEAGTVDRNFTGKVQDVAVGLYDFPAREYSSTQGRWISPDPGESKRNRYAYTDNAPLAATDPLGLWGTPTILVDGMDMGWYGEFLVFRLLNRGPFELLFHDFEVQKANGPVNIVSKAVFDQPEIVEKEDRYSADRSSLGGAESASDSAMSSLTSSGHAAPTNPDGSPKPPTNDVPKLPDGKAPDGTMKPNEWVQGKGNTTDRPVRWDPRYPIPGQSPPNVSWDPQQGHWDHNDGKGNRTRWLPGGVKVDHYNNPIPMTTMWDKIRTIPPSSVVKAGTGAILLYLIVSEGSRLYLPRNLVPVP